LYSLSKATIAKWIVIAKSIADEFEECHLQRIFLPSD
jgi:hypothetical protein